MNNSEILRYLAVKYGEEIKTLTEDMARGTAKDHGEYKYACGIVRGLMVANGLLQETAVKLENNDD
jgi:hypothetical protein